MIIEFWTQNLNPITCYKSNREINRMPERMDLDQYKEKTTVKKRRDPASYPTGIYNGPLKGAHPNARGVTIEDVYGQKIPFSSAVEAAEYLKIKPGALYNILGGTQKNKTTFKIYKS
jgi:hypothetical protein